MGLAGALTSAGPLSAPTQRAGGPTTMNGPVPQNSPVQTPQTPYGPIQEAEDVYALDLATLTGQGQGLMGQIQQILAMSGLQSGQLTQSHGFDLQRLANSMSGLGLDRQALGLDQQDLAAQFGFLDRRQSLADQLLGNTNAGFGLDEESVRADYETQLRQINNRAAAGGAWFSPETRLSREDAQSDMARNLSRVDLAREGAGLGRKGQQIDFDAARQNLMQSQTELGLDSKRLDLAAQNLGIDRAELDAGLNSALQQMGIQAGMDAMPYFLQLGQVDAQYGALVQQMLDYALRLVAEGRGGRTGQTTMLGPVPVPS